jgi:hypothetical protein
MLGAILSTNGSQALEWSQFVWRVPRFLPGGCETDDNATITGITLGGAGTLALHCDANLIRRRGPCVRGTQSHSPSRRLPWHTFSSPHRVWRSILRVEAARLPGRSCCVSIQANTVLQLIRKGV